MKKILVTLFVVLFLGGIYSKVVVATPISQITPASVSVNSFELFWPIVAGKTMGDSLYFVKTFKEGLHGKLIFGSAQKADYSVFLATKRIIEAEKLILEGKPDMAEKTLTQAIKQLDKATVYVSQVLIKGIPFQEQAINMVNRLSNLETFIPELMLKADKNKEALSQVLKKVEAVLTALQVPKY